MKKASPLFAEFLLLIADGRSIEAALAEFAEIHPVSLAKLKKDVKTWEASRPPLAQANKAIPS